MQLTEAARLAHELMNKYGLAEWTFKFNRNKRRLGVCRKDEKRIELSQYYVELNDKAHVVDTILHEIAHAVVGTEHGHDEVWKGMCLLLGCRGASCDDSADMPEGAWQALCGGCHTLFTRHRKPKRLRGRYCVACGPEQGKLTFADVRPEQLAPVASMTQEEPPPLAAPLQLLLQLW